MEVGQEARPLFLTDVGRQMTPTLHLEAETGGVRILCGIRRSVEFSLLTLQTSVSRCVCLPSGVSPVECVLERSECVQERSACVQERSECVFRSVLSVFRSEHQEHSACVQERSECVRSMRSIQRVFRSVLSVFRSVLSVFRSILSVFRSVLSVFRSIRSVQRVFRSVLSVFRSVLSVFRSIRSVQRVFRSVLSVFRSVLSERSECVQERSECVQEHSECVQERSECVQERSESIRSIQRVFRSILSVFRSVLSVFRSILSVFRSVLSSRVCQRPRGLSLIRAPPSRLAEGLMTSRSAFGHREEFDWLSVGRKSGRLLQSSQDLRVLKEEDPWFSASSYLDVAVLGGQVQRRGAVVVSGVDVGSVSDQQSEQRRVSVQRSDVKRREAVHSSERTRWRRRIAGCCSLKPEESDWETEETRIYQYIRGHTDQHTFFPFLKQHLKSFLASKSSALAPITQRIDFNILLSTYSALNGLKPQYKHQIYEESFSFFAPQIWNKPPENLTSTTMIPRSPNAPRCAAPCRLYRSEAPGGTVIFEKRTLSTKISNFMEMLNTLHLNLISIGYVDELDRSLEGAQTVAQLVFAPVAEAEVLDVAEVGHPEDRQQLNSIMTNNTA
ncbi:hypothetical protein F7725_023422 [Dissostichus mawsoni]|uniref:Uncharacterized protein n=1 Tax=Dissostichus mawsoni TaxID=36200 RepID=A0A7J5Z3K7_DISMA|nr:hypothetical protein F7725_023422 [Dissostichus mawsoni]